MSQQGTTELRRSRRVAKRSPSSPYVVPARRPPLPSSLSGNDSLSSAPVGEQLTRKENLESYLASEELDRQDSHQEEPYNGDSDTDKSDRTPPSSDAEKSASSEKDLDSSKRSRSSSGSSDSCESIFEELVISAVPQTFQPKSIRLSLQTENHAIRMADNSFSSRSGLAEDKSILQLTAKGPSANSTQQGQRDQCRVLENSLSIQQGPVLTSASVLSNYCESMLVASWISKITVYVEQVASLRSKSGVVAVPWKSILTHQLVQIARDPREYSQTPHMLWQKKEHKPAFVTAQLSTMSAMDWDVQLYPAEYGHFYEHQACFPLNLLSAPWSVHLVVMTREDHEANMENNRKIMEEDNHLPFAERRPMLASVPCDHPKLLTGDPPAPRVPDDGWKNASNRAGIVESNSVDSYRDGVSRNQ